MPVEDAVPLVDIDVEPVPVVLAPVAEPVDEAQGGRVDGSVTPPLYHIHQRCLLVYLLRLAEP